MPTQIVSSDEYLPLPQTEQQKEVEARLIAMSDRLAKSQGLSRRRFFQTAAGMAASFVAMNDVFGRYFIASEAEAATPELAEQLAAANAGQFVFDGHTHFLRDDTRLTGFVKGREAVGQWGWNKELSGKEQTLDDLKFNNYVKEIYMDSDTKITILTNSPSVEAQDWFIPQEQVFKTRAAVNAKAGTRRMLAHFTIHSRMGRLARPGRRGQSKYTNPIPGRATRSATTLTRSLTGIPGAPMTRSLISVLRKDREGRHQEHLHHRACSRRLSAKFPRLRPMPMSATSARRKGLAAVNFLVYHSGYRWVGANPADAMAEFEQTGRSSWTSDLAEIPEKYGVTNVYGDLGQIFAWTAVAQPRLAAALMGTLVKGLGSDRIVWGTDAVWTGAPQWQIEGLRRLEIPEDMQKKYRLQTSWVRPTARSRPRSSATIPLRLYELDRRVRRAGQPRSFCGR